MAYYHKIGFLALNEDHTKFLVCEKDDESDTDDYIMPGGIPTPDERTDEECLRNEIEEELDCGIDFSTLVYVGEYHGPAAGWTDRDITMKVYTGELIGVPRPCSEIERLHWIGKEDAQNPRVSFLIRTKIMPDLVKRKILR
jgi:8-oxo-dGTP pyrophosphatase MutT (NUDIX family)